MTDVSSAKDSIRQTEVRQMTKKFKISVLLLSVVMLSVFVLSIGFTAAIWTSGGAGSGENTVAPAVDSPEDWNPWAKYFEGIITNDITVEAVVTGFHGDEYALNLETVIIPSYITVDGKSCKVVELSNSIFADVTFKQLPVTVYISPYVKKVNAMTFANLPNLKKVVFGVDENGAGENCVVENFTFASCPNLSSVVANGRSITDESGAALASGSTAFVNCAGDLSVSA